MGYKIINRKIKYLLNEIEKNDKLTSYYLSQKYLDMYDQKLLITSLYYNLINQIKSITTIFDHANDFSIIFVIIRGCFDSYIRIEAVLNNYDKYLSYEKERHIQEEKYFKKIKFDLKKMTKKDKIGLLNYIERIALTEERLKEINPKFLKEKEWRAHINVPESFEFFYKLLSEHVHCGYSALMQNKIKKIDGEYKAVKKSLYPNIIMLCALDMMLNILYLSIFHVYKKIFFESFKHNLYAIDKAMQACFSQISREIEKARG